ncbi:MAG: ABC transporter substrate-binding protein, partial [Rickettsiales bacterium]|nr:ABC transporter substrate-binding protein [Rickettsiales bacterium]
DALSEQIRIRRYWKQNLEGGPMSRIFIKTQLIKKKEKRKMKKYVCILCLLAVAITNAFAEAIIGAAASGYPPLQYHDEKGNFVGYDVDILAEVGKILGYDIKWENPKYDGVLIGVQSGKYDFAPGFVETKERKKKMDFTDAYFQGNYSIFVANKKSKVKKTSDLKNAKIAVVNGSFQSDLIDDLYPDAEKVNLSGNEDIALQVISNRIDAGILPYTAAIKFLESDKTNSSVLIGDEIPDTGARIVVKKGNKKLLKELNSAIKQLRDNGTQRKLHDKWYPNIKFRNF